MIKIGLIVNPIAGMGGKVGLKGTDGDMYERSLELGAEPVSPARIEDVLKMVERDDLYFLSAPGKMGEDYLKKFKFDFEVIGDIDDKTSSDDTRKIAGIMIEKGIKVLVFVGGDGTARDILDVVGMEVPVIAIPSGVKMFSSAFVVSAHGATEMINTFGDEFIEKEILDINEEAFRDNRLDVKYYGTVRVPDIKSLLQGKKAASNVKLDVKEKKEEVARHVVEKMEDGWVYILGPGTTLKAIADRLGFGKTLLGIDAVYNGKLVGYDVNEKEILQLISKYGKARIVITPIGGSGYIFGRGSRQISSEILKKVGRENIIIVSTLDKVGCLECLRTDSGNYQVDKSICGSVDVIIGYDEELVMEVRC